MTDLIKKIAAKFPKTYREDIEQELFIESCECEKRFDPTRGTTLFSFCYPSLFYKALHWVEEQRNYLAVGDESYRLDRPETTEQDMDPVARWKKLDPVEQLIYRLKHWRGMSLEEIVQEFSDVIGIKSRKTLSKKLIQINQKLDL
ncbi:hypothetical protein [Allomuricauda sp. M10]|uniref:hypothetical protein n=1 Tax=Allomuricauda sp. M10 TaxID=2683292 RepID=UPI001D1864B1|nr:hypothetical protein [Muricauda sp. M10]